MSHGTPVTHVQSCSEMRSKSQQNAADVADVQQNAPQSHPEGEEDL